MADKVRIDGVEYDIPENLTIGEQLDVARELGPAAATEFGRSVGVCWIAVRRVFPNTTLDDLAAFEVEYIEDSDGKPGLPPTNGAAAESQAAGAQTQAAPMPTGTPPYGSTAEHNQAT